MTSFFSKQASKQASKLRLALPLAIVSVFSIATPAQATLTRYTLDGVTYLTRMQGNGFDVSWSRDPDLFKSMLSNNPNLIEQIISVSPTYNNEFGIQNLTESHFGSSSDEWYDERYRYGKMSWWGAKAWVNYLNSINYAGSNQWSLPVVPNINLTTGSPGTETALGHLAYNEIGDRWGGWAYYSYLDRYPSDIPAYWMDGGICCSEWGDTYTYSFDYLAIEGVPAFVSSEYKFSEYNRLGAWVMINHAPVSAVPVPGAIWLMSSGLLGLLSLKRRNHAV